MRGVSTGKVHCLMKAREGSKFKFIFLKQPPWFEKKKHVLNIEENQIPNCPGNFLIFFGSAISMF